MRSNIHWLDRLRSFLSGHSAKVYANRRLAREDLHALEAQRARAVSRLTEDLELLDRYVNPLERYMDGDRLVAPLGTILDRRSGKNLPLVWTELDLREFRRLARVICDINPFAVGFLGLLTDFHLRQGFGWQVQRIENGKLRIEKEDELSQFSILNLPLMNGVTISSGVSRAGKPFDAGGVMAKSSCASSAVVPRAAVCR